MPAQLTESVILAAIDGFEAQKSRIDQQIQELKGMLPGGTSPKADDSEPARTKRKFSPDALRRMREAQARRWAKVRGESKSSSSAATPEAAKPKRKLSAAGRRAISQAAKKRWALLKQAQPLTVKKSATKKAGTKAAPAKAAKRAPRKAAAKKTAPVITEAIGQ